MRLTLNHDSYSYSEAEAIVEAESFRADGVEARIVMREVSDWQPYSDR